MDSKKAAKSIVILMTFSLGSKFLGLIRESMIAAKYGSNTITDSYFFAMSVLMLLLTTFTKLLNTTLIPILTEIKIDKGIGWKVHYTNSIFTAFILFSITIILVTNIFAKQIIDVLAHGFNEEQVKLTTQLLQIGSPIILFSVVIGTFRGYLQSEGKYFESAASDFPYNLVFIVFLVFFAGQSNIVGLMLTSVLAVVSQITIQLPFIKKANYSFQLNTDFKGDYFKKFLSFVPAVMLSAALNEINQMVDKVMASSLMEGSISALNYAARVNGIVLGIMTSAIATVLFPILSLHALDTDHKQFRSTIILGINLINMITIPATVGIIVLAKPLLEVLFLRGAFDDNALNLSLGALIFYVMGLPALALKPFLKNIFFSLHNTRIPMQCSIIAVCANVLLNFAFVGSMKHAGLAMATSISAILTVFILIYFIMKKEDGMKMSKALTAFMKITVASFVMGIVVKFIYEMISLDEKSGTLNSIFILTCLTLIGAVVYILAIALLRVDEIHWLFAMMKKKFLSHRSRNGGISHVD